MSTAIHILAAHSLLLHGASTEDSPVGRSRGERADLCDQLKSCIWSQRAEFLDFPRLIEATTHNTGEQYLSSLHAPDVVLALFPSTNIRHLDTALQCCVLPPLRAKQHRDADVEMFVDAWRHGGLT